jgi:N-acetylneuraminate epimerase
MILRSRPLITSIVAALAACCSFGQGEWKQLPPLPDPLGVAAPFAGVSGDALIVAGGANFPDKMPWEGGKKVWHDRVWVLDAPDGRWRDVGRLPRPLAYGVSLRATDAVMCVGGSDSERHYADAFRLSWKDGVLAVTPLPKLPVPLATAAGAVVDATAYVACGATEPGEKSASNRAFALDAGAAAWRELPPLPAEPRILPVAAGVVDDFYVFGGAAIEMKDGKPVRRYLRDAWRYHPKNGWHRLPDMPKPAAAAPSPAMERWGRIHIIAGDDGSLAGFQPIEKHPGFPATILAYDIPSNTWHEAGKTPAPRATVPTASWRSMLIVPSGEVRPGVRSAEVWSYAP